MAADMIAGDLIVQGQLSAKTMILPAGSVGDSQANIASPIQATKLQHQYEKTFAQYAGLPASTQTAASDQWVAHIVRGLTATPIDFKAGCVTVCVGAATITVDLLRNGTTVLTAPITLNNSQTAYQLVTAAGFSVSPWAVGDVLEVKITATAGGGTLGKGLFAQLNLREDAN